MDGLDARMSRRRHPQGRSSPHSNANENSRDWDCDARTAVSVEPWEIEMEKDHDRKLGNPKS